MQPSSFEPHGSQRASQSMQSRRLRPEESWIEVSQVAQPLSSLPAAETRPSRPIILDPSDLPLRSTSAAGSSQDEYEESSSESDQVLSSSNEDVSNQSPPVDVDVEDDDNRTALGPRDEIFTPQPNIFSHPPSVNFDPSHPTSYFQGARDHHSTPNSTIRRSRPHLQHQRTTSGSYQPDHDAALRASLTTLLSCAAAVRPKSGGQKADDRTLPTTRATAQPAGPTALRLVSETTLDRPRQRQRQGSPNSGKQKRRSRERESSKDRQAKKLRSMKLATADDGEDSIMMSPTLASWFIYGGVVLVFSAISFSAGYVWGREIGQVEGVNQVGYYCQGCGQEAMRGGGSGDGLRRMRWSNATGSIRA